MSAATSFDPAAVWVVAAGSTVVVLAALASSVAAGAPVMVGDIQRV